ncbi:MAG: PAS domain S-box protein, partial [Methanobacteriota archaeon]
ENIARENERRFRKTLDQINMVAFHLSEDGAVQYCNNYLLNLTGWTHEEFIGKNFFDLAVPPHLREIKRRRYRDAINKQSISQHEEMAILLRSGEIRDLDIINTDLWDEKGRFLGYMCIGEDVTDRKRTQIEIETWKRRYELLTSLSRQAAYEYDITSDSIIWSDTIDTVLGYTPGEMAAGGKTHWFSLVHPDDLEKVTGPILDALEKSGDIDVICRYRHKLGHYLWLSVRGYPDSPSGLSSRIIGTITDITPEKEAEIALYESEERFRTYLENAPYGIFISDRDGTCRYVNPAGAMLTGYLADELIGMNIMDLSHPEQKNLQEIYFSELLEHGHIKKTICLKGNNTEVSVELDALLLPGGEVLGFCQDITEKLHAEAKFQEISKKLHLLQSITRHDVMNVVTSIRAYTYLLNDSQDSCVIREFFDTITRLLKKIEELFIFSKHYEQIAVNHPSWNDVNHLISRINTTGVAIINNIPENLTIYADPMLDHVFSNLYHNSCNHGGSISTISCSLRTDETGIRIIWEDDGVGILEDEKERIFDLGYGKNTGYGLYLISEILGITGISIRETGKFGNGARFEIIVPKGLYRFGLDNDRFDLPEPVCRSDRIS